ncbi:hypothetical protein D3C71_1336950 [compost metagenome]
MTHIPTFIGVLVSPAERKILPKTVMREIKIDGIATIRKYVRPLLITAGSAPINRSSGSANTRVISPKTIPAIADSMTDCLAICRASSIFPAPTRLAIMEEVPTPIAKKIARYTLNKVLEMPTAVTSLRPSLDTNKVSTNPTTV